MKKEIEIQKQNIQKLVMLAKENPKLKIIPLVDSEVVSDDGYNYWAGNWGSADIDECWCEDERIYFKSSDYEELVENFIDKYDEGHPTNKEYIEKWAEEKVNNLPWEKVIVVGIMTI